MAGVVTIRIGDIAKAEQRGYERAIRKALGIVGDVDRSAPGNPDALQAIGSRLEGHAAGMRYLIFYELQKQLRAELEAKA